jgi:hypothetical protein
MNGELLQEAPTRIENTLKNDGWKVETVMTI